ncbi:MAG: PH domain-containing protein, partial [Limisphaerales bacterium]
LIHRLGWVTKFNLGELQSFAADPTAMDGSIRLFGNGGLFAFTGLFRNKKLGNYRAFATDPKRAVVLRLKERVIVVTPDDPFRFVEVLGKFEKGK